MCLIAFSFDPSADIVLKIVANRDEYYARPTAPLSRWHDKPIIAGRDLQADGTWLGITQNGRMAALTNHRNPSLIDSTRPSRGTLVSDFLAGRMSARDYMANLMPHAAAYNPFNLLCFDGQNLLGFESHVERMIEFNNGFYAVSNADFDSPWPKLTALKDGLQKTWSEDVWPDVDALLKTTLFSLLHNSQQADDGHLPQTGIPLERERALSAAFISTLDYGTRASSIVAISKERSMIIERSFVQHTCLGEVYESIDLNA